MEFQDLKCPMRKLIGLTCTNIEHKQNRDIEVDLLSLPSSISFVVLFERIAVFPYSELFSLNYLAFACKNVHDHYKLLQLQYTVQYHLFHANFPPCVKTHACDSYRIESSQSLLSPLA